MVVFTGVFVKAVQLWTCSIYKLYEINKIVCWCIWWSFFSCAVVVQGLFIKVRLWCSLFYIKPLCISPWTLSFNLEKFWNFWHGTSSFGISTNLKTIVNIWKMNHSTKNSGNLEKKVKWNRYFQNFWYSSQGFPLFWKFQRILFHSSLKISKNSNQNFSSNR